MVEGRQGEHYFVLVDEVESGRFSASYEIDTHLPGHPVIGLKGWDDFVVCSPSGRLLTVPTVPMAAEYVAPLGLEIDPTQLRPDARFVGKVKWYKTPLVFGGSPTASDNLVWVSLEEHVGLVRYWNGMYRKLKG